VRACARMRVRAWRGGVGGVVGVCVCVCRGAAARAGGELYGPESIALWRWPPEELSEDVLGAVAMPVVEAGVSGSGGGR